MSARLLRAGSCLVAFAIVLCAARRASAETLQAPVGGKAFSLRDRVVCGVPSGGWTSENGGHALRPPPGDDAIGRAATVRLGTTSAGCGPSAPRVTLIATAPFATIDPASFVVYVDDGRAELRGKRLKGVRLAWNEGATRRDDTCLEPRVEGNAEVCTFGVGKKLPASPTGIRMTWYPAGASVEPDASTFDADGREVPASELELRPSKVVLARLVAAGTSVDVSAGAARMRLEHADAITTVDCAPAFCDIENDALVVRGVTQSAATLRVRARLLPRVVLVKGNVTDTAPLLEIPILRCPMTVESGPPLADVDDARVAVKLEGRCAADARSLRFFVDSRPADVVRLDEEKDAVHALLSIGRVQQEITIRAVRADAESTLVGVVKTTTRPMPAIAATLELEDGVPIDFIPTNRFAIVRIVPPAEGLRVVVVPVNGVYEVADERGVQKVRAIGPGGAYVALRFAIRSSALSGPLATANLGIVQDAVQRPIRQANIPVALSRIADVRCVDKHGRVRLIQPGVTVRIPYRERDGCFVTMYRDRLLPEQGVQKLVLDINVTAPDGSPRPEAKVSEPTSLRAAKGTRVAWIKGVEEDFDRVTVRVAHAQDEQHYATKTEQPLTPPASQWSLVMSTAWAHLFLTAAIPTVLYRVAEKANSGVATLNFGVLARLTWVDSDGRDGLLALETGVLGIGLSPIDNGQGGGSLTNVATLAGLGLGMPVANRGRFTQTSIGIHAWFEYEISRALNGAGSPWGFLFGPSITFGNAGTYL